MRVSYLDGLRGWASLVVFFGHIGPMFLLFKTSLPVMPIFFDGTVAVYVFFTISAYVLSVNYLRTNDASILVQLGIRRYPRLTLPILVSCIVAFIMMKAGLMHNLAAAEVENNWWLRSFYNFTPTAGSVLEYSLFGVYMSPKMPLYNGVLWTMFYEFCGSMLLLAYLFLFRRNIVRVPLGILVAAFCWHQGSPLITFAIGAMLAGLSWRLERFAMNHPGASRLGSRMLLVFALVFAMWRSVLIGESPMVLSIIAAAILTAVIMNGFLQRMLESRLSRLLGELSYPLYLTHMLVLCSWSSWVYVWLHEQSLSWATISAIVFLSSCAMAMCAAKALYPVERAAIMLSKRLSGMVFAGFSRLRLRVT